MGGKFFELSLLIGTYWVELLLARLYFRAAYPARKATEQYLLAIAAAISLLLTWVAGWDITGTVSTFGLAMYYILHFVFAQACYTGSPRQFAFDAILVGSISLSAQAISSFVTITLFSYQAFSHPVNLALVFAIILSKSIHYIFIRMVIEVHKSSKAISTGKTNIILSAIALVSMFLFIGITQFAEKQTASLPNTMLAGVLGILSITASMVIFLLYQSSLERNELAHRLKQVQDEAEYYAAVVQNEAVLTSKQHEYIRSLETIKGMLESGIDPEPYIGQMIAGSGAPQELAITADFHNKVVNTILNNNKAICKENGIRLKISIEYYDLAFLRPLDTGTLLNNAFNNAVQACKQVPGTDGRRIWLRIYRVHDELVIGMKNTKADGAVGEKTKRPPARENADASRGHGIVNMRKTAAKYGGSIHAADNGGEFTLTIRLKIPMQCP